MTEQPLILVTGASGQLGSELRDLAAHHTGYRFLFYTRSELPLNDNAALAAAVHREKPVFVVNCAAYTTVDKAEAEREEAFQINATAVGVLAKACAETGSRFLHISTDYVFSGADEAPRKESDAVGPINVYGESKLAGEEAAQKANPDSVIIRTSWVYSVYGKNFVKTMLRLMSEKESISVVNDQHGSPTYAADLTEAILHIIGHQNWQPGIYHFSNEGTITWFDFANEIALLAQSSCVVKPTTTAAFPTPAKRPAYSVMDKSKIQTQYGIVLRPWKESLAKCVKKLKDASG